MYKKVRRIIKTSLNGVYDDYYGSGYFISSKDLQIVSKKIVKAFDLEILSERQTPDKAHDTDKSEVLNIPFVGKAQTFSERELLIGLINKAMSDQFRSDKPMTPEDTLDEFLANL
jgi:hypothetical protein